MPPGYSVDFVGMGYFGGGESWGPTFAHDTFFADPFVTHAPEAMSGGISVVPLAAASQEFQSSVVQGGAGMIGPILSGEIAVYDPGNGTVVSVPLNLPLVPTAAGTITPTTSTVTAAAAPSTATATATAVSGTLASLWDWAAANKTIVAVVIGALVLWQMFKGQKWHSKKRH